MGGKNRKPTFSESRPETLPLTKKKIGDSFAKKYYVSLFMVARHLSSNVISICLRLLFPFVYECYFHLSSNVISICLRMLFPFVYECYFHLSKCYFRLSANVVSTPRMVLHPPANIITPTLIVILYPPTNVIADEPKGVQAAYHKILQKKCTKNKDTPHPWVQLTFVKSHYTSTGSGWEAPT